MRCKVAEIASSCFGARMRSHVTKPTGWMPQCLGTDRTSEFGHVAVLGAVMELENGAILEDLVTRGTRESVSRMSPTLVHGKGGSGGEGGGTTCGGRELDIAEFGCPASEAFAISTEVKPSTCYPLWSL